MLLGLEKSTEPVEIYNVGSEDQIDVKTIAEIVAEACMHASARKEEKKTLQHKCFPSYPSEQSVRWLAALHK